MADFPSSDLGYVDQQTGGFIGENTTYSGNFEASRPHWWQIPGSIQASAALIITFQNGSLVALMGGIGIANNANAHTSVVGLRVTKFRQGPTNQHHMFVRRWPPLAS
jgi:hypothetical protein